MKRMAMMAATLVAAALTAGAQSGELGGGFSILLDNDHFDSGGGAFVYGAVRPAPFYSLRGTLMAATADTDSDVLWPAEFSTLGIEGTLLLHCEPAPNLRFRAGGGVGAYTYENTSWSSRHGGMDPGFDPYRDEIEDETGFHALAAADLVIFGNGAFFVEVKQLFIEPDVRLRTWREDQRVYETVVREIDLETTFVSFGVRGIF